jgi:hemerythrin superfamily protein
MSVDIEKPHDEDVVAVLLRQHERIRELFAELRTEQGEHKQQVFDELRALLAAHETGEEMVVRPATRKTVGDDVADARNHEEDEANHVLADLEKIDVSSAEFDQKIAEFEQAVLDHAAREEAEEFPGLRAGRSEQDLKAMGRQLLKAERIAPTHPHPSAAGSTTAQWVAGPFASLLDRARDAISR